MNDLNRANCLAFTLREATGALHSTLITNPTFLPTSYMILYLSYCSCAFTPPLPGQRCGGFPFNTYIVAHSWTIDDLIRALLLTGSKSLQEGALRKIIIAMSNCFYIVFRW